MFTHEGYIFRVAFLPVHDILIPGSLLATGKAEWRADRLGE